MIERALTLGIQVDDVEWLKNLFTYDGSDVQYMQFTAYTDERLTNEILAAATPDESYVKRIFLQLHNRRLHKAIASYDLIEFSALVRERLSKLDNEHADCLEQKIIFRSTRIWFSCGPLT